MPPGRAPAAAVVPGAEAPFALRIGGGPEQVVAARRAGDLHRRVGGDPPVVGRVPDDRPGAVALRDLDDRDPVPGLSLAHVVGVLRFARGVDDVAVRVFVVDRQHDPAAVREQGHPVIVVAEGAFLARPGAARLRVEIRGVRPHRIAPPGDDVPAIPLRHGDGIQRVRGDRLEPEATVVGARRQRFQSARRRDERGRAESHAAGDEAAPRQRAFRQTLEIRLRLAKIGAGVGRLCREDVGMGSGHSCFSCC